MESVRNSKQYLTHIPVQSYLEADVLSRGSTWNILGYIRTAGAAGAAADEIARNLRLPSSIVYSTLKDLRRLEFISILPREFKKAKERKKRYVCERTTWGKYRVDSSLMNVLEYEGIAKRITERLRTPILEMFSDLFEEFKSKNRLKPFLPSSGEKGICPVCGRNHEAAEFVYALILAALDPFITESKEFRDLMIEKGYAR